MYTESVPGFPLADLWDQRLAAFATALSAKFGTEGEFAGVLVFTRHADGTGLWTLTCGRNMCELSATTADLESMLQDGVRLADESA